MALAVGVGAFVLGVHRQPGSSSVAFAPVNSAPIAVVHPDAPAHLDARDGWGPATLPGLHGSPDAPAVTPAPVGPAVAAGLAVAAGPAGSDGVSSLSVEQLPRAGVASSGASHPVVPAVRTRDDAPTGDALVPAPVPVPGDDMTELRDIADAERLLASDPAGALARVRADAARFPRGYLREERAYVEVMALFAMGQVEQAAPAATAFLRAYPDGAFSRRVRQASAAAKPAR
jgi:hypothetical protein